jgi:hypothetical protein
MRQSQTPEISIINPRYVGQDFDAFLAEDGIAADVKMLAIKKLSYSQAMPSPQTPT